MPASGFQRVRIGSAFAMGLLVCLGVGGCYVPNGGWTLRSGLDFRTHRKPAGFVEMVDTRWDEWNRVAQVNAMQPTWQPPPPRQFAPPPGVYSAPASSHQEPAQLPAVPEDLPASPPHNPAATASAQPAGSWLFYR